MAMSSFDQNEASKPPKSFSAAVSVSNVGVHDADEPIGPHFSCWTLVELVGGARRSAKGSTGDLVAAETMGWSGGSSWSLRRLPAVRRPARGSDYLLDFGYNQPGERSATHPQRSTHLSSCSNGDER
jgi:hypothetical protein